MKVQLNKNYWHATFAAALLSIIGGSSAMAQSEQQKRQKISPEQEQIYVVSAKAGGVNHVTGAVRVTRDGTGQTQILAKGDELSDKDQVSVGETGRIEILLNPGSFLRLAENTNLELTDTALESLKLKLASGSALFEATAIGGEDGAEILIATPQAVIRLERSGIYRLNTDINATEIYVWKGAARVGNEIIKGGRKTVIGKNGVTAEIVKFDKDDSRDALDLWSKDRAKELAKTNNRLKNRELTRAFSNSSLFGSSGFGRRSSFGAGYWVFDRLTRGYCFVPHGFGYWDSPYGYNYGNGIFYDRRPVVIFRQPSAIYNPGGGGPTVPAALPTSKMPRSLPPAAAPLPTSRTPRATKGL